MLAADPERGQEKVNGGERRQGGRTGAANGLKRQSWPVTCDARLK